VYLRRRRALSFSPIWKHVFVRSDNNEDVRVAASLADKVPLSQIRFPKIEPSKASLPLMTTFALPARRNNNNYLSQRASLIRQNKSQVVKTKAERTTCEPFSFHLPLSLWLRARSALIMDGQTGLTFFIIFRLSRFHF
jgi:hypothetical protein